jgi:hypothetical protein
MCADKAPARCAARTCPVLADSVPFPRCRRCHWMGFHGEARKPICVAHMAPWSNGFLAHCHDFHREPALLAPSAVAGSAPPLRTVPELARAVGKSAEYIHQLRRLGKLRGLQRVGHCYFLTEPDFQRIVRHLTQGAVA